MSLLRALVRDHRGCAMLFLALALCVRLLIPQGFMPGTGQQVFSIQICLDGVSHRTVAMVVPTVDGAMRDDGTGGRADGVGMCAFGALSFDTLGGAAGLPLLLAMAFVLSLGFAPVRHLPHGLMPHVRPPLRGPPLSL